jgi:hypothetical protein
LFIPHPVYTARYAIPPFIIYKGRVHISAWYMEDDITHNWKLSVSENGWTNHWTHSPVKELV